MKFGAPLAERSARFRTFAAKARHRAIKGQLSKGPAPSHRREMGRAGDKGRTIISKPGAPDTPRMRRALYIQFALDAEAFVRRVDGQAAREMCLRIAANWKRMAEKVIDQGTS